MFPLKQEHDALDLTNRSRHLLSPTMEHEQTFSSEDDAHDCIAKVIFCRISVKPYCNSCDLTVLETDYL
jgi:hypothetical protein